MLSMASRELSKNQYERLEFLGDRVLNLIVSDYLYHIYPEDSEGQLSEKLRFTSNDNLDGILETLDGKFREQISLFRKNYPAGNQDLSADDLEAFLGDLFLSHGLLETQNVVEKYLLPEFSSYNPDTDYISRLQIYTQQNSKPVPEYRCVRDTILHNNSHEFHEQVFIGGEMSGEGFGDRKSRAKQRAAAMALEKVSTTQA